jgi:hypothetical protein
VQRSADRGALADIDASMPRSCSVAGPAPARAETRPRDTNKSEARRHGRGTFAAIARVARAPTERPGAGRIRVHKTAGIAVRVGRWAPESS